jgi:hypothetical protein
MGQSTFVIPALVRDCMIWLHPSGQLFCGEGRTKPEERVI